jgi:uncharacterized protein YlbG (UPF0298 family)
MLMEFEIKQRQSIIVYLQHLKQSKQLRKYGSIQYVSRKMKYAVLYLDKEDVAQTVAKLEQLRFVKQVLLSPRAELREKYTAELYRLTDEDRDKIKR